MKRLIIAAVAATLMGGGLVGVSAESANAVCPYTGCVETSTKITIPNAPIKVGQRARICVRVITEGNGKPKGDVVVKVKRLSTGRAIFNGAKHYPGERICFRTHKIKHKGKYLARAAFQAGARTPFGDSDNVQTFRVKKRH